jgi:hypothetical protein
MRDALAASAAVAIPQSQAALNLAGQLIDRLLPPPTTEGGSPVSTDATDITEPLSPISSESDTSDKSGEEVVIRHRVTPQGTASAAMPTVMQPVTGTTQATPLIQPANRPEEPATMLARISRPTRPIGAAGPAPHPLLPTSIARPTTPTPQVPPLKLDAILQPSEVTAEGAALKRRRETSAEPSLKVPQIAQGGAPAKVVRIPQGVVDRIKAKDPQQYLTTIKERALRLKDGVTGDVDRALRQLINRLEAITVPENLDAAGAVRFIRQHIRAFFQSDAAKVLTAEVQQLILQR